MNGYWQSIVDYLHQLTWLQLVADLQWVFIAYFMAINLSYLILNYISAYQIVRYMREYRANYLPPGLREYQPPVSIVLPAYNEERSVVSSVRSLLKTSYPEYEIVVVNDGSSDRTREALIEAFGLVPVPEAYRARLATEQVKGVYASPQYPRVRMVDKANGARPTPSMPASTVCVTRCSA